MPRASMMIAPLLTMFSLAAWAQFHDFDALRSIADPGPTAVRLTGFYDRVVELNDSMVGDDTTRARRRDADRASGYSSGSAGTSGATTTSPPQKNSAAPKASAKRFVCTIYCKSATGPTIKRTFSAASRHDAAIAAGDAADQLCREAGQPKASSLSLPDRQCVEQ